MSNNAITGNGKQVEILQSTIGLNGSIFINDTNSHSYNYWFAIQIIEEAVIGALIGNMDGDITGTTLSVGTIIYGNFTTIQLTSGSIIAYKG